MVADGADNLWGGADADTFVWTRTSETSLSNKDEIFDFSPVLELDRLDLRSIDADETMAGVQSFAFAGQTLHPLSGRMQRVPLSSDRTTYEDHFGPADGGARRDNTPP